MRGSHRCWGSITPASSPCGVLACGCLLLRPHDLPRCKWKGILFARLKSHTSTAPLSKSRYMSKIRTLQKQFSNVFFKSNVPSSSTWKVTEGRVVEWAHETMNGLCGNVKKEQAGPPWAIRRLGKLPPGSALHRVTVSQPRHDHIASFQLIMAKKVLVSQSKKFLQMDYPSRMSTVQEWIAQGMIDRMQDHKTIHRVKDLRIMANG